MNGIHTSLAKTQKYVLNVNPMFGKRRKIMTNKLCEACKGRGQIVDSLDVDGSTVDCPVCDGFGYYLDDTQAYDELVEMPNIEIL